MRLQAEQEGAAARRHMTYVAAAGGVYPVQLLRLLITLWQEEEIVTKPVTDHA